MFLSHAVRNSRGRDTHVDRGSTDQFNILSEFIGDNSHGEVRHRGLVYPNDLPFFRTRPGSRNSFWDLDNCR